MFAGYTYWFPKAFGFTLDEKLGKAAFWCWFIGFYLAFMPLYVLGFMGATRRMQHYDDTSWQPLMLVAALGALVILAGIVLMVIQLVVSIRTRDQRRAGNDPWDGRTLEWSIPSPAPPYNFALLPRVKSSDSFWEIKKIGRDREMLLPEYAAIHMPRNSANGFITAFFASFFGFAMIWHIWWLAIASAAGMFIAFLVLGWRAEGEDEVAGSEVARYETAGQRGEMA